MSRQIEALVVQWAGVIQRAARQYGLSAADLDEVVQDVRVRLWALLQRQEATGTRVNATYAYRAAASAAVDLVRRDRVNRGRATLALEDVPAPAAPDAGDMLVRLHEALRSLQRSRRVAVRLHLDGHSLAEIARLLDWTPAQARNQVYRGLADLRRLLSPDSVPSR